ncbi:hypothetical protein ACFODZ_06530 [Marinicella sediminis]|uniref:Uncharacterized protein n=1 Tax=Marinicella sediminis TaxID=1792834 RepID=A0ABV7J725_9GAMM|nr:hypothetical protein [Marinicella sediminis]
MNKFLSFIICLLMIPTWCAADNHEKPPTLIADGWTMVPKEGHGAEFEAALKAHLKMRMEKGDPRHWDTYVPVTGDKLNNYVVRSCCFEWADQDKYAKWSNEHMGEHFNETVHPHVQKYMHNFTEIDTRNSNWGENTKANFVGVTHFEVKSGKGSDMSASIKSMSTLAKDNGWPRNWSWSYPVGGDGGVTLATPYANYADMAPMEESFYDFVVKHKKSKKKAEKMFDQFNGAIKSTHYTIYRHRVDLSMHEDED